MSRSRSPLIDRYCVHCGAQLRNIEHLTHGYSCDICEQAATRSLWQWAHGQREDDALDAQFAAEGWIH